jgi:anhydro-N-acetylmuramic acid kinase
MDCPVVSNFRAADIAAGGQGAPLTPLPDYLLLRSTAKNRVVVNIGGIANLTVLPANCSRDDVIGFDSGPGNMILDALVRMETRGRESCDFDGMFSSQGQVCGALLDELLRHPFFDCLPPKSAGRREFGETYARDVRGKAACLGLSFCDLAAI